MVKLSETDMPSQKINKKKIKLLFFFTIIISACEILSLRFGLIPKQINDGILGVGLIPPFAASILFFILWHDSWLKSNRNSLGYKVKKIAFWLVVFFLCLTWGAIYYVFIFS